MYKRTAIAPSNIAFIKYWGRRDEVLRLPENGSISMNLSNLYTTTTVEFDSHLKNDKVVIDGINNEDEARRVTIHLDRIRKYKNQDVYARVKSKNSFPVGTGLSSSASGFAALTVAAASAIGLTLGEKELSILARQGSGSACRSIPDGFVEWLDGDLSESSYATSIYPAGYWDILDIVAIVSEERKKVSSSEGQKLIQTSPFFEVRKKGIANKIRQIKEAMQQKNFSLFGQILEEEALNMHVVMFTSSPPLIYWTPQTLILMKLVHQWRREGLEVYFTINTGQDVHLIVEEKNKELVINKLKFLDFVKEVIVNRPSAGTHLSDKHLF